MLENNKPLTDFVLITIAVTLIINILKEKD